MRRVPSLVLALTTLLGLGTASAQTTVAVLGVEAVDAPLNTANLLSLSLENRVRQTSGFKLVAGKELEEIKLVFGCVDEKPSCMAKAGRSLGAAKLAWGSLKKAGTGYNLTIKWLDVAKAQIEKFVSENIGHGNLSQAEAGRVIQRLTRSFLVSSLGMIKISANVAGANVMMGARRVGATEQAPILLRDVPSGTHLIRITKDGYRAWTQQVMVQGGETTEVDAELVAEEAGDTGDVGDGGTTGGQVTLPPPPPPKPSNKGWKIAFWTGAAVTVGLAVGLGISGGQVLSAENDKDKAIGNFREQFLDSDGECRRPECSTAFSDGDVCKDAKSGTYSGEYVDKIKDACDKGDKFATITNALIGATLGVAAISGYLYYKAYISKPEQPAKEPEPDSEPPIDSATSVAPPRPAWMLSPAVGPNSAGLGFEISF